MKTTFVKYVPVMAFALLLMACGGSHHETNDYRYEEPMTDAVESEVYDGGYEYTEEPYYYDNEPTNSESYAYIPENNFLNAINNPLSTFSIDVDNASYANVRRFLNEGQLPPRDAIRIEEMINYFDYDYEQPRGKEPFSLYAEVSDCPWNEDNRLVHIGLQGVDIPTDDLPATNLVFLIDVSGSMGDDNKLPLLKKAFKLLTRKLDEKDNVAIVVYAGSSGVVLPSTPGNRDNAIIEAFDRLQAGGSTAGAEGIELAYRIAKDNFKPRGNNRIILATDGDFNVGPSSDQALIHLIEEKRNEGIDLTVLGFGMGNYKDSKMEAIANNGNGNYFYIDDFGEAKKVLVDNLAGTLLTIAKDVKIQVEFNPAKVESYRLIGYENRVMAEQDFENDRKDAGELGAGHSVTALYEIVPIGNKRNLRYQDNHQINDKAYHSNELLSVKFRYKAPKGTTSKEIAKVVMDKHVPLAQTSNEFRFSASVASFGMLLKGSQHKGAATWESTLAMAEDAIGWDHKGYRVDFVKMIEQAIELVEEEPRYSYYHYE